MPGKRALCPDSAQHHDCIFSAGDPKHLDVAQQAPALLGWLKGNQLPRSPAAWVQKRILPKRVMQTSRWPGLVGDAAEEANPGWGWSSGQARRGGEPGGCGGREGKGGSYRSLLGWCRGDRGGLSSEVPSDETRGIGPKCNVGNCNYLSRTPEE